MCSDLGCVAIEFMVIKRKVVSLNIDFMGCYMTTIISIKLSENGDVILFFIVDNFDKIVKAGILY